jgi:hypothetical protein
MGKQKDSYSRRVNFTIISEYMRYVVMIVEFVPQGRFLPARNEEDEDCYPLWGVFTTPSTFVH